MDNYNMNAGDYSFRGFGLGLRREHYQSILASKPTSIDWFEIISENYMLGVGTPLYYLDRIREHYPVAMHGVSLGIGNAEPLNMGYLSDLVSLVKHIEPMWVSDHICWTSLEGAYSHDLLPLPFTHDCISYLADRIHLVQEKLGRRILLENISSYISFDESEMPEWEFLSLLSKKADCYLLLDLNNIYVNASNHKFSAEEYLENIPWERVKQFHLAGHHYEDDIIVDTHGSDIVPSVLSLYKKALSYSTSVSPLIERDSNIPSLSSMVKEISMVKDIYSKFVEHSNNEIVSVSS